MAVSRAFSFPLAGGGSTNLINETNYGNRPNSGSTALWASETIYCEDVRMPEGWLAFNRVLFVATDTYEIRVMGRVGPDAPWSMLLTPLDESAASGQAISQAGSNFVTAASPAISAGLATIPVPLMPEIRLEVWDVTNTSGGSEFIMAGWLLGDV